MTQSNLINQLQALKKDIEIRPNNRAITKIVSRHIHSIELCMNYGYSRKDIYNYIFDDDGKSAVNLDYFNRVIIYRARKKAKSNKIDNRSVQNEKSEVKSSIKIEKPEANNKPMNAFERLKERQKNSQNSSVNHNSGSSMEDVEKSFARFNIE
ncbi:hypothetical protein JP28_12555 [Gallibacterium anatis]|uniref:hypothetical protein n=1 Tax=Gallibacterium anatis TaxID=750 RepID=UPI000531F96B|nr:hypothetical protein [Gallibacterium anatis]KGQ40887.1 hypothetical protein JP28_12555 [Gallibacterium anatis]KGQ47126.1 hypothetical protein IO46_13445 [Gallibacterium anatis]KGQ52987.1 hypothetical protein IO44_11440 [Gallibacterium anatis str. Avicor]